MKIHHSPSPTETKTLGTQALRDAFLIGELFQPGKITAHYTDLDRMIAGGAMPGATPLSLPGSKETGTAYFLERREIGIVNVGAAGAITVGGTRYAMAPLDCLYIGTGEREVLLENGPEGQAQFYFISTPAHAKYPTAHATRAQGAANPIGDVAKCNRRRITKYIHPDGIKSCQLVLGFTEFESGSVWNTMPPHTHSRRTEIYFYFDLGSDFVVHLLGEPTDTRHIIVRDREVALSPSWSIHAGVGTGSYRFIWAMGGDNQTFSDMDQVAISDLR
jgi:4-deoxy-L-threo-5-hexosulose-uronate ketol-isomerase